VPGASAGHPGVVQPGYEGDEDDEDDEGGPPPAVPVESISLLSASKRRLQIQAAAEDAAGSSAGGAREGSRAGTPTPSGGGGTSPRARRIPPPDVEAPTTLAGLDQGHVTLDVQAHDQQQQQQSPRRHRRGKWPEEVRRVYDVPLLTALASRWVGGWLMAAAPTKLPAMQQHCTHSNTR
jgi:hypothetical protein